MYIYIALKDYTIHYLLFTILYYSLDYFYIIMLYSCIIQHERKIF